MSGAATGKTAAMTTPPASTEPSASAPVKKPAGLIWAGVILVVLAIVLWAVAIFGIMQAIKPSGTNFAVPGSATLRLEPGTYAVWISNGRSYGNGTVRADVEVSGPDGRVPVDRVSGGTYLSDGSLEFVTRAQLDARHTAGTYQVSVDSETAELARVGPPVSASWLGLSIVGIVVAVFAGLIGVVLFIIGLVRRGRAGRPRGPARSRVRAKPARVRAGFAGLRPAARVRAVAAGVWPAAGSAGLTGARLRVRRGMARRPAPLPSGPAAGHAAAAGRAGVRGAGNLVRSDLSAPGATAVARARARVRAAGARLPAPRRRAWSADAAHRSARAAEPVDGARRRPLGEGHGVALGDGAGRDHVEIEAEMVGLRGVELGHRREQRGPERSRATGLGP